MQNEKYIYFTLNRHTLLNIALSLSLYSYFIYGEYLRNNKKNEYYINIITT